MPRRPEPTPEQLRLAFRQLHHPNTWPSTLEASLQHPIYGKCLRAMARNLGRPAHGGHAAHSLPTGPAVPPVQPAPTRRHKATDEGVNLWTRKRGIDMKRAAANDRDD